MQSAQVDNEFKRGWSVLLAAFIGMGISMPSMIYYSARRWVRPWQDEFGWSRAEIGGQTTAIVLVMMLLLPFAGRLIDRYGLRSVIAIAFLGYGTFLLGFPLMAGSIWELYVLSAGLAIFGVAATAVAFTRAVNAFFVKYRGLALGICLASTGVMAYLMPRFMTPFVAENGWRTGYVAMFLIIIVLFPIVYLLIRDAPEDGTQDKPDNNDMLAAAETGLTFTQAVRTATFWKLGGLFFLVSLAVLGLIPAFIPLLQDNGMTLAEVGRLAGIMGVSVMLGRLLVGFLLDRIFAPYLTAVVFSLVALGCFALGWGGIGFALPAAIALGFGVGAEVDLLGYYTARYFGLAHYGVIYGLLYSIFVFGAGISPVYIGYVWDVTGNYDIALILATLLLIPAIVLSLVLPKFENS